MMLLRWPGLNIVHSACTRSATAEYMYRVASCHSMMQLLGELDIICSLGCKDMRSADMQIICKSSKITASGRGSANRQSDG